MDLISYKPLWWMLVLPVLGMVCRTSLVERSRLLKLGSFLLRCAAVVLLVTALCRPFLLRSKNSFHLIHLLDVSESVDLASAEGALRRTQTIDGRTHADNANNTVFILPTQE